MTARTVTLTHEEGEALLEAIEIAKRHAWGPNRHQMLNSLRNKLRRADSFTIEPDPEDRA